MDTTNKIIHCVRKQATLFDAQKKEYPILFPTETGKKSWKLDLCS